MSLQKLKERLNIDLKDTSERKKILKEEIQK